MNPARAIADAVHELDPHLSGLLSSVGSTLALIEVAEQEIEQAVKQWPLEAERLARAFLWLQPIGLIGAERLYRAHCAELLRRIVDGEDMVPATDAELVAVLSEMSLRAPLKGEWGYLYWRTMKRCMPDIPEQIEAELGSDPFRCGEHEQRRADEEEAAVKRRISKVTVRFEMARAERKARKAGRDDERRDVTDRDDVQPDPGPDPRPAGQGTLF